MEEVGSLCQEEGERGRGGETGIQRPHLSLMKQLSLV